MTSYSEISRPAAATGLEQTAFLTSLVQERITFLAAPVVLSLVLLTVFVHELAHLVTAALLGIPIMDFSLLEPTRLAPAMYTSDIDAQWMRSLLGYVGGLVAGGLWLLVYVEIFVRREFNERGPGWWLTGLSIAALAAWQLGQGMIEGGLPQAYVVDAGNPANSGTFMQLSVITMGATVHLAQTRLWRGPWLKPIVIGAGRQSG